MSERQKDKLTDRKTDGRQTDTGNIFFPYQNGDRDQRKLQNNNDTDCPLYCGQKDSQQHLLVCDNAIENFSNVNYMDLFSRDVDKIMKVVEAMKKALQNRTECE